MGARRPPNIAQSSPLPSKRAADEPTPRASKRTKASSSAVSTPQKAQRTSPKKSPHFKHEDSKDSFDEPTPDVTASEFENEESGYEDDDASVTEDEDEEISEEYVSSEDDKRKSKKKKANKSTPKSKSKSSNGVSDSGSKGAELWREGVRSHLAPGEEILIAIPKARAAGRIPYTPSTVHPNTFLFLADLRQNNDRAWLKAHDADFRTSEKDFKSFIEELTLNLIDLDPLVPELPVKDIVYRIYRDVRFSSDPTPYKSYFSAGWSRTGRKGPYAHYYMQIAPGNNFIGGGYWAPEADTVRKMREAIDTRAGKLKKVLNSEGLRTHFLGGGGTVVSRGGGGTLVGGKNAKKMDPVKAFCEMNKSNALKKKPKDYPLDHPELELLKLRNFTIGRRLTDEEVLGLSLDEWRAEVGGKKNVNGNAGAKVKGKVGLERISELFEALVPFITYLNGVVMPDGDDDDDDDSDDDEEDEDEDEDEDEE